MVTGLEDCEGKQGARWPSSHSIYPAALILWSLWTAPSSFSGSGPEQDLSTSPPPPSFEADLLRIDGDRYIVTDLAGVERQVYVGKDTEVLGQVKAGDRIQLCVQPDGHVQTIIVVMSGTRCLTGTTGSIRS